MKNKKFILQTFRNAIKVDEDELPKIYGAMATGEVIILRQGWFNPKTFDSIVADGEAMTAFKENHKYEIRDGKVTEYPKYQDLFAEFRDDIKKISEQKKLP